MNEHAVHMALRGRAISTLPTARKWENDALTPASGVEYVEETFRPTGGQLFGARVGGQVMDEGLYILKWWGIAGVGTQALSTSLRALLNRFPPGSSIAASDGSYVQIKGDNIPSRSDITNPPYYPGRAVSTVTVPFYVLTINPT